MVYVLVCIWYMCLCVHLRLPYDCVMIVVLLIPACLFYLTRTLGRNRHAICGSPMIVIHTYIHTYTYVTDLGYMSGKNRKFRTDKFTNSIHETNNIF